MNAWPVGFKQLYDLRRLEYDDRVAYKYNAVF